MNVKLRIAFVFTCLSLILLLAQQCSPVKFQTQPQNSNTESNKQLNTGNGGGYPGIRIDGPGLVSANGVATLTASGGTGPYTFALDNGSGNLMQIGPDTAIYRPLTGVMSETVIVTVTDSQGQSATKKFYIGEPGSAAPDFGTDGFQLNSFSSEFLELNQKLIPFRSGYATFVNQITDDPPHRGMLHLVMENGEIDPGTPPLNLNENVMEKPKFSSYQGAVKLNDSEMIVGSEGRDTISGSGQLSLSKVLLENSGFEQKTPVVVYTDTQGEMGIDEIHSANDHILTLAHHSDQDGFTSNVIYKHSTDLQADTNFGQNGRLMIRPFKGHFFPSDLIQVGNEYFVLALEDTLERTSGPRSPNERQCGKIIVAKFNIAGILQPSFGKNGYAVIDYECIETEDYELKLLWNNDSLFIAGTTRVLDPASGRYPYIPYLLKLNSTGEIDKHFAENGWFRLIDRPGEDRRRKTGDLLFHKDRIYWAVHNYRTGEGAEVLCFESETLASCGSFGTAGRFWIDFGSDVIHKITQLSITPDGHLLVNGGIWDSTTTGPRANSFSIKILIE